jgi:hypothetical protein
VRGVIPGKRSYQNGSELFTSGGGPNI